MSDHEIEELIRQSVVDYRRYHLRVEGTVESDEEGELEKKSRIAWDTLRAAFGSRAECTEPFLADAQDDVGHIQQEVIRWKNELRWPPGLAVHGAVISSTTAEACKARIKEYLVGSLWPFIKVMR